MKLIRPSFKILEENYKEKTGLYRHIERIARICYKSEDRITEDSAMPFVDNLIKSGHLAATEHGTVYLKIHWTDNERFIFDDMYYFYSKNPYSKIERKVINQEDLCPDLYITTNYRVILENKRQRDLEYQCVPTPWHHKRISVLFITDIGVLREYFRHRKFSMMQESTRFCSYNKDKFNNELTFILPPWEDTDKDYYDSEKELWEELYIIKGHLPGGTATYLNALEQAEKYYMALVNSGYPAQQARLVLPLNTKSEAVMTGFIEDWKHFFNLRCSFLAKTGKPHPQASELADSLYSTFIDKGIITDLVSDINTHANL